MNEHKPVPVKSSWVKDIWLDGLLHVTTIIVGGSGGSSFVPVSYISTTGSSGALPGTITPPADAPNSNTGVIAFVVYP